MISISKRILKALALTSALQLPLAAPAEARAMLLVNSQMLALFQVMSSQNQCWIYSYDLNGNRVSRNSMTFSSTATWGTSVYGCSTWTSA